MLLSFSHVYMFPMIVNGLREYAGEPISSVRVKRQTIRKFGTMNQKLFGDRDYLPVLSLHLWWKSRTPNRYKFGEVTGSGTRIRIERTQENDILISKLDPPLPELYDLAIKDGFNSIDSFLDYFVPDLGNVFEGVLFQW